MTDSALATTWAVCGIAAAAARFVPVPLLDDVVRERALRQAVVRTVRAHGLDVPVATLEPLWGEGGRQRSRLRRGLGKVGRRLLTFPVRKYTALFGAVRGVPADVLRVVLVARTVDRLLTADPGTFDRPGAAAAVRDAVAAAVGRTDLRLVTAAVGDGLSRVRGLGAAAVGLARRRGVDDADPPVEQPVAAGAASVDAVLGRADVQAVLARFDAEVDRRLQA